MYTVNNINYVIVINDTYLYYNIDISNTVLLKF